MYYASTDNLGSINLLVKEDGTIASDLSYDAWGRQRNAQDWTYNNVVSSTITDRGFTFHENMTAFNLINMNGRAYDPMIGQFLSPDPFVQSPDNSQSYNRFSYCMNNPLKFTDPSGYLVTGGVSHQYTDPGNGSGGINIGPRGPSAFIDGMPYYGSLESLDYLFGGGRSFENVSSWENGGHNILPHILNQANAQILRNKYRAQGAINLILRSLPRVFDPRVKNNSSTITDGQTASLDGIGVSYGGNEKYIGGFFNTKKELIEFMMNNSFITNGVEIGGFKLKEISTSAITYFVDPWVQNDDRTTIWQSAFGRALYEIEERYHTHPLSGDADFDDYAGASQFSFPSFIIRRTGVLEICKWSNPVSGGTAPRLSKSYSCGWYGIDYFMNH